MASLAPASGTTQTYIWRDTEMMAKKADTLPISVELMSQHSIQGGKCREWKLLQVFLISGKCIRVSFLYLSEND